MSKSEKIYRIFSISCSFLIYDILQGRYAHVGSVSLSGNLLIHYSNSSILNPLGKFRFFASFLSESNDSIEKIFLTNDSRII